MARASTRRSTRITTQRQQIVLCIHLANSSTYHTEQTPPPAPRPTRRRKAALQTECMTDQVKPPRRSTRITPTELVKRESALEQREAECSLRIAELDARSAAIFKREQEADAILSQAAIRESQAVLSILEEHFTCPLCYEIMAQPYSLNPGQCGHTFCALCILRHFFSRLHKACGGWHESVDCPMCRSLLVITPDRVPRLDITFPFVPNRTAAVACEALINQLATSSFSTPVIKREPSETSWSSDISAECQWGQKKGSKTKEEEEMELQTQSDGESALAGWREGGHLRTDWIRKDREGKHEMVNLLSCWTTMQPKDFIELKHKYGV
ncbi:RING finger domain-containing protein [Mycena indigotica]|uniref:RING finger domain-containing protein n=1 Tax=Mycena indigotica TaxID=2126181 RepID=A0A8H6T2R0_9AGAR|nr:RING finger domain-containing protein [Mycena indigotica]KAF7309829.1 RING finger domain-containing protein [Mycena indigotica]